MEEPRWNIITASQYEWERAALDFIRQGLPDHDPYRAWANFEFQTPDGAIYEVDLLVLTKQGFFLVEIKSWPGRVRGDASTWTCIRPDGKTITEDNPVMLANRKAKALSSLLKVHTAKKVKVPWLDPIVFLSSDDLICDLTGPARNKVVLKDRDATEDRKARKGILAALINRDAPGIDPTNRSTIDSKVSKALARAFEKAPEIQKSRRSRRVGDYLLTDLISEGPGYQDRLAKRVSMEDDFCRIRQYTVAGASNEEERQKRKRAAAREYRILKSLHHPNILPVLDYKDDERGPALLFRYPDPNAIRFDHYLATHCHKLTSDQRLDMLRQVADAIRYAHRKRVVHRALGPQSILVMRDEGGRMKLEAERNADRVKEDGPEYGTSPFDDPSQLYLQVFNWQVGVRESSTSSGGATNVDDLIDTSSLVYMSPEATADPNKVTEASDIFSLGAIAYHLFSNRPPAGSAAELSKILRENKGLSISSVLDGAGPKLEEFIQWSTHPDVSTRVGSVEDFLALLDGDDGVVDELTAPDEKLVTDPLDAGRGDRLEHGFTVERELGQGATAKALLVSKGSDQSVLKIALTDDDNIRLEGEAEALASIQSEFVVKLLAKYEMNGRVVLELQKAGDKTLAAELRSDGVPPLEMLGRYGDDLMSAVASLERHGVVHRDLKPDNIGIRSLTSKRNQLILFDFSLALSSLDNIRVGTPGYGDPFLVNRKPQRWDLAAERYSAGVTLYEMSMGAGVLPQWGDGQSDPAYTEDELVIDAEKFEPSVREGLVEFFLTALHRDPKKRFDNAEEMRWSWNEVFKDAEKRKVTTSTGEEVDLSVSLDQVDLETPIAALPLSTKARNALERADVLTVKGLLNYPVNSIYMMRRVGNQTRQEIIRFVTELRKRFPDIEAVTKRITTQTDDDFGTPNLELLHQKVVGTRNSKKETEWKIRCGLLGITASEDQSVDQWPSQADVADACEITRGRVGQVLAADRKRWAKDSTLNTLRTDLCEQIERLGGVVTIAELIEVTLLLRPANDPLDTARQQRMASAIARAAVETESSVVDPRFQLRRIGGKTVIAITQELATYAGKLGEVADELAKTDPLPPQLRVFQELYEVTQPPSPPRCQPLSNERLIKLAAAMSSEAAVSSRQELYPIGMSAERALRLGIGALTGLGLGDDKQGFTVDQVRARIRKRYPKALPLPDRPELDAMLQRVGLEVQWDADRKAYRRRRGESMFTSGSSVPRRQSTATSTRVVEHSEEKAEARQMTERLQHAYDDGGFLVLTVTPSEMRACESEVMHRFDFLKVSFDDLLFEHLRSEAEELEVDWNIVQKADSAAKSSHNWTNLSQLVSRVIPKIEKQLLDGDQPTLLVHPGLIARYDQMILLEHLRDNVGHDVACPCLWVLVATDEQSDMPVLDGAEIPLISSSQRTKVSTAWIENRDRGRGNQVATAENTTGTDGA